MEKFKLDRILHGGDYNPEQWLDYPEILKKDIAYMKEARVNCVTLGVFSWVHLEPREGVYEFEWLRNIMDNLYANGIYTILATPTGALPHWMTEEYDEVMKMSGEGIRRKHGQRHNYCPSSPVLREKMRAMDAELAKNFGDHEGLVAWHISNECGGDVDGVDCHCPYCEAAFRDWLKNRYKTLDELNHAWWTSFWGNRYTDWNQIHTPSDNSEHNMHGIKLDYHRFVSDQILDFTKAEIMAVKQYSNKPCVCNFIETFKPIDCFKWAKELDIVSYDNYPLWHTVNEDDVAVQAAFAHTLYRSLKKQPYLMMESTPSVVNWTARNTLKRPGMHALSSFQALAYGANSVQYFQWRKGRGGFEKYHGAVIDHKNGNDTRVFREVSELGHRLELISEKLIDTCNRPKVAFVFDWENWWAVEDATAILNPVSYIEKIKDYFKALCVQGIDVDIVNMDDSLEQYELVIAPLNYMYRGSYVERIRKFVEQGGTYVTTYWSGEVDETDLCFLDENPLRDVLGIRTEEIDVRPQDKKNYVRYGENQYEIKDLCAIIHPEQAQVLATYTDDFYAGYPALSRNCCGKGQAYFIAAEAEIDFIKKVYEPILHKKNLLCELTNEIPEGIFLSKRVTEDGGKTLWFVMNFKTTETVLSINKNLMDIECNESIEKELILNGYQCRVLEER